MFYSKEFLHFGMPWNTVNIAQYNKIYYNKSPKIQELMQNKYNLKYKVIWGKINLFCKKYFETGHNFVA